MRRASAETRGANDALETINAAAAVIALAEHRVPPASAQKRRWGSCLGLYWCFGSHKQSKRIGHAVSTPEPTAAARADAPGINNPAQAPSIVLPFIAPPSSPASFIQSEPPSAAQSPVGLLSTSVASNMYSPVGRPSIFAIGPYAHETQLVSPPVFSAFTTEPSTAPFTPPPESVHLTTPSSPEVPFARLLDPNLQNVETGQRFPLSHYEFQSYQFQPGSPVGHLVSPGSCISGSGTSSPLPDGEFAAGRLHFLDFGTAYPPKLLNLEKMRPKEWSSTKGSGTVTPDAASGPSFILDCQKPDAAPLSNSVNGSKNDEPVIDRRVSFEITAEEVIRCVEKKPTALPKALSSSLENGEITPKGQLSPRNAVNSHQGYAGESSIEISETAFTEDEQRHQKQRTITLGSPKEFNFDNVDGADHVGSDWWSAEKVIGKESGASTKWSFFPMMQPGVS